MQRLSSVLTAMAFVAGSVNFSANCDDRESAAPVPKQANANPESEVYRASEVIGQTVNDDQGQQIGQIKDLVINGASREVLYAVVALDEAKEKDTVYIMPWSVFQPSFNQRSSLQYFALNVPQSVWIQAPYWSVNQWRQAPFTQWAPRVDQYYAKHFQVNSNRASTIQTNKPVLKDERDKDSATNPRSDSTSPKPDRRTNNNPGKQPQANEKPSEKPKEQSKSTDKPAANPQPKSAAKNPQLPTPNTPDPAGPKDPPPNQNTNKPAPKNPK